MGQLKQLFTGLLLAGVLTAGLTPAADAGETRRINFAAFEKSDPGFNFEPIVLGRFADFIQAMQGSQVLLISHTADAVGGDVINIQQDVLRENSGQLGDHGINCQLSFVDDNSQGDSIFSLGGLCKIIEVGGGKDVRLSAVLPMTNLPDTAQGVDAWIQIYEDKKSGIAFYANVSGH